MTQSKLETYRQTCSEARDVPKHLAPCNNKNISLPDANNN